MFLINGEILSESLHPSEYRWMQEKFEEIRKMGKDEIVFSAFRKRNKLLREDGRMIPVKERRRFVSVRGSTNEANGIHQDWHYASNMSAVGNDGSSGYKLKRATLVMTYETRLSVHRDIELIFYFLYLSNNKNIVLLDYEKANENEAELIALRAKAEGLIYLKDSPLNPGIIGSEQPLRNLALSWGVGNALSLDIYGVMRELWNAVNKGELSSKSPKRGYSSFITEALNYGDGSRRAIISIAIQKGTLVYEANIWKMVDKGGAENFLCGVPVNDEKNKTEYVIKYILNNKVIYQLVESSIEEATVPKTVVDMTFSEKVDAMKRHELLTYAKTQLGWTDVNYKKLTSMIKSELVALIKEGRVPENENEPV